MSEEARLAKIKKLQGIEADLAKIHLELGPEPKEKPLILLREYLDKGITCVSVMISRLHYGGEGDDN